MSEAEEVIDKEVIKLYNEAFGEKSCIYNGLLPDEEKLKAVLATGE